SSNSTGYDAAISKLNAAGDDLVYSTYIGGAVFAYNDGGIAVDSFGNAYITGSTSSSSFPITSGAYQSTLNQTYSWETDAFVTKLNSTGNGLSFSTFYGGHHYEMGKAIAVDQSGNAYVVGTSNSTDLPLANAYQATNRSNGLDGLLDVYVAK